MDRGNWMSLVVNKSFWMSLNFNHDNCYWSCLEFSFKFIYSWPPVFIHFITMLGFCFCFWIMFLVYILKSLLSFVWYVLSQWYCCYNMLVGVGFWNGFDRCKRICKGILDKTCLNNCFVLFCCELKSSSIDPNFLFVTYWSLQFYRCLPNPL